MKRLKLLLPLFLIGMLLTSCLIVNEEDIDNGISLEELLASHDLWYVDYHSTEGTGDVPFVSRAFTMSFLNGRFFANNNIVDIGFTGNGLGIQVGSYGTYGRELSINHVIDGRFDFEVVQLSNNQIRLDCLNRNVSYYLIGYQRNNFDYDRLFYDNIEYFLQEYVAWERTSAMGGVPNIFDEEHYLQFTPENNVTFYSSQDPFGIDIDMINWNFVGGYEVADVIGFDNLKVLTLNYDNGDREKFELTVINDETIELYHLSSETIYTFAGRGFIQIRQNDNKKSSKSATRNNGRKRTKIKRKKVEKTKVPRRKTTVERRI